MAMKKILSMILALVMVFGLVACGNTSSKDVYNLVINGEYVVGLSYESGVIAQIKDGAPVECIYMEEGNTAMAGGAAITEMPTRKGWAFFIHRVSNGLRKPAFETVSPRTGWFGAFAYYRNSGGW